MTTYNVPNTEDLLSTAQLPMGLIIQPLAKLRADEVSIFSFFTANLRSARKII